MRRTLTHLIGLVILLLVLIAPQATHAANHPTDTPIPTQTPYATNTPYATSTPAPTYTPYPSPTASHRPALALSATSGMSGTAIVAIGTDFPANTTLTVYWDGQGGAFLGRSDTDDTGHARIDLKIPATATPGGHEIFAVGANHTSAGAPFTVDGPGSITGAGMIPGAGPDACASPTAIHINFPLMPEVCLDPVGILTSFLAGAADMAGTGLKNGLDAVTNAIAAPFVTILAETPDLSDRGSWGELGTFFDGMQALAFSLYGVLALIGLLKFGLANVGRGNVGEAIDILWRGVLGIAAILALPEALHLWFSGLNDLTSSVLAYTGGIDAGAIARISFDGSSLGTAIGSAAGALWATILMAVFGTIFSVVGIVILILTALTKLVGLFLLAVLYGISPLMIACWVLPEASGFARGWLAAFVNVSLWGVGYAVVMKMIAVMEFGLHMDGLLQPLMGLAGLIVLYRVPKIIASLNPGGHLVTAAGAHAPAGALTSAAGQAARLSVGGYAAGLIGGILKFPGGGG